MTNLLSAGPPVVRPRFLTAPPAATNAAADVVGYSALAGLEMDDAEQAVLEAGLGERPDGQWAASQVGLIAPRQNMKTHTFAGISLTAIGMWGERLVIWTAHRLGTAMEAWLMMRQLVADSEPLARERPRARHRQSGGAEIVFASGARIVFMARAAGATGRGFSADRLFLDEAYDLDDPDLAALLPALSARPNHQVWYGSSAPKQTSTVLRRICKAGRRGAPGLAYVEFCAPEDAASDDRAAWAAANPAFPARITEETILAELATLSDEDFRRERLGIWHEDDEAGWQILTEQEWSAAERPRARLGSRIAFGAWIKPDRSRAAIAVAGMRADAPSRLVELTGDGKLLDYRPGSTWVLPRLLEMSRWHPVAVVTNDKTLRDSAAGQGLTVHLAQTADQASAAGMLHDGIRDGSLRQRGQAELTASVASAVKRTAAGGWVWDTVSGDVCPIGATSLALWGEATPRVQQTRRTPSAAVVGAGQRRSEPRQAAAAVEDAAAARLREQLERDLARGGSG